MPVVKVSDMDMKKSLSNSLVADTRSHTDGQIKDIFLAL
jgi:hypothetical protein